MISTTSRDDKNICATGINVKIKLIGMLTQIGHTERTRESIIGVGLRRFCGIFKAAC